jgi:hypothetical protein
MRRAFAASGGATSPQEGIDSSPMGLSTPKTSVSYKASSVPKGLLTLHEPRIVGTKDGGGKPSVHHSSVPDKRPPLQAPLSSSNPGRRGVKDDIYVVLLNEKAVLRSWMGRSHEWTALPRGAVSTELQKKPTLGTAATVIKFDVAIYVGGFELIRTSGRRWQLLPDGRIQMPEVYERDEKTSSVTKSNLLVPTQAILEAVCTAIVASWSERGRKDHPQYDPERPWPYPLPIREPNPRAHRWDDLDTEMPTAARGLLSLESLAKARVTFREEDANKRRLDLISRLEREMAETSDPTERVILEDTIARLKAEMEG